jgi:hypothetical protein
MFYGARSSGDSRIEAQGRADVLIWALDRITDSAGNKMEFYYTEIAANTEYVPLRIEYAFSGGVSGARVEFGYGAQSSPKMYLAGSMVRNTRLLQTITTYVSGQAVKEYRLGYETSPGSKRKRLTGLTECSLVSGTVCLQPTTFTWQGARNAPVETNMGSRPSGHNISFDGMHLPVDIDGDGEQELVYNRFGTDEYWYVGSTIEGGSGYAHWGNKQHEIAHSGLPQWTMDVNGDGLSDLVYRRNQTPSLEYWVLINKGDGNTQAATLWATASFENEGHKAWPMDVNNDGRMDLVYNKKGIFIPRTGNEPDLNYYALIVRDGGMVNEVHLGQRSVAEVGLAGTHWVMDINGDGRSDLVYSQAGTRNYYAMVNNGNETFSPVFWATRDFDAAYDYAHWLMDVNGDGLMDLVYCNASWKEEYRVLINKGNRTVEEQRLATRPQATLARNGQHWIADTNADGIMDLLYKPNQDQVWSLESQPDGSRVAVFWGNLYSNDSDDPAYRDHLLEIDTSGDGLPDLINASRTSVTYRMLRNASRPDLMTDVRDGYGNVTAVQYKLLTDDTVYNRTENPYGQYPDVTVEVPMNVVSKVTVPDGVGGVRATEYFYKKLRVNSLGRGTLGFAEVISTDTRSNIRVETKHNQTFPRAGLVDSLTRCLNTGAPARPRPIKFCNRL